MLLSISLVYFFLLFAAGFVMFRGGLLDVEKLTEQLKRSEKARADTESMLISLREELGMWRTSYVGNPESNSSNDNCFVFRLNQKDS